MKNLLDNSNPRLKIRVATTTTLRISSKLTIKLHTSTGGNTLLVLPLNSFHYDENPVFQLNGTVSAVYYTKGTLDIRTNETLHTLLFNHDSGLLIDDADTPRARLPRLSSDLLQTAN